jgi:hypothetical protein
MATLERLTRELPRYALRPPQMPEWLDSARHALQAADGHLMSQQYQLSYLASQRSMAAVRLIERSMWDASVAKLSSPLTSPGAISFVTLPWHFRLGERIAASLVGPNRLEGGDFEDPAARANWQRFEHRIEGIQTAADPVPAAAHTGQMGLRLAARAEKPAVAPPLLETPPLWIVSPAIPIEAGDLFCIRGWVRIHPPLNATVDGLLVFDSISGEALAERIGQAAAWHEFVLYRIAPRSGPLTLTFALTGLGEAWLDDVTVQVLAPPRPGSVNPWQGPPPVAAPR